MAKEYTITKEEGIRRMCEAIREAYAISDAIDDEHLATNSTFSSVKIDSLLSDIDTRVDKLENSGTGGGSGEENVIEVIKINGVEQTPVDKAVDITVPNYSEMTGATSDANGTSGLVPAPTAGDQGKFLKGDGTWGVPKVDSSSTFITGRFTNVVGNKSEWTSQEINLGFRPSAVIVSTRNGLLVDSSDNALVSAMAFDGWNAFGGGYAILAITDNGFKIFGSSTTIIGYENNINYYIAFK